MSIHYARNITEYLDSNAKPLKKNPRDPREIVVGFTFVITHMNWFQRRMNDICKCSLDNELSTVYTLVEHYSLWRLTLYKKDDVLTYIKLIFDEHTSSYLLRIETFITLYEFMRDTQATKNLAKLKYVCDIISKIQ